ncbi:unnamed protein product, partial [Adineta steineri]
NIKKKRFSSVGGLVIVSYDTKHAYEECGESGKNFTTTLICRNGINDILLSPFIYTAKDLNPQWTFGGPTSSSFAVSESGWIPRKLFAKCRRTIRKIHLPSLFNELYISAFTPKQVVAGFARAGI